MYMIIILGKQNHRTIVDTEKESSNSFIIASTRLTESN